NPGERQPLQQQFVNQLTCFSADQALLRGGYELTSARLTLPLRLAVVDGTIFDYLCSLAAWALHFALPHRSCFADPAFYHHYACMTTVTRSPVLLVSLSLVHPSSFVRSPFLRFPWTCHQSDILKPAGSPNSCG